MSDGDKRWAALISWLKGFDGFEHHVDWKPVKGAGRGLVATQSRKPTQPLLIIPAFALLNPLTLLASPKNSIPVHLFPNAPTSHQPKRRQTSAHPSLNTTQLLTLHLALTKDSRHESEWKVYLDTIPSSFAPWHPLTWVVPRDNGLLRRAPPEAVSNVLRVKSRFEIDFEIIRGVLHNQEPFKSQRLDITTEDILWAWLNVNTRSVSLPLGLAGPSDLFNHTLVPLLDLVNHSSLPTIPKPRQISTPVAPGSRPTYNPRQSMIPGKTAFCLVALDEGFQEGEELRFEYHGHANTELWAEYGFAEVPVGGWKGAKYSELNVGHLVERQWHEDKEKQEALEKIGCWGRQTLHAYPDYEASHSLLMTLRVLFLEDGQRGKLSAIATATVTFVSEVNEAKVYKAILDLCKEALDEAKLGRKLLEQKPDPNISVLWDEYDDIARGCIAAYS